jgi:hypothetical protein
VADGSMDRLDEDRAAVALRDVPGAVTTIRRDITSHLGGERCFEWRQVGRSVDGVIAYNVCGLARRHLGPHRAGWSGHGEQWNA